MLLSRREKIAEEQIYHYCSLCLHLFEIRQRCPKRIISAQLRRVMHPNWDNAIVAFSAPLVPELFAFINHLHNCSSSCYFQKKSALKAAELTAVECHGSEQATLPFVKRSYATSKARLHRIPLYLHTEMSHQHIRDCRLA